MRTVKTELGMDTPQFVTFMSDCVASRINNADFVGRLVDVGRCISRKRVREIAAEYPVSSRQRGTPH